MSRGGAIWHHCGHVPRLRPFVLKALTALCGGIVLLTWGAERFVEGAAATAINLGISSLLVGLVVVGFATSAPEMLVSAMAAANGTPILGIGNAIGSNIANIGLVLGVTALITPLAVRSAVLRREFPMMCAVLVFASLLMLDQYLSFTDGVLLATGLSIVIGATVWLAHSARGGDVLAAEFDQELARRMSTTRAVFWVVVGLVLLLVGSRIVVSGAVDIARLIGVSDMVIGLTIVAVGTSLPELAASVMSALKREPEIALGNVIGSNMFNALGVLAAPALIAPTAFGPEVVRRDLAFMLVLTFALFAVSWGPRRPGVINRWEGAVLLVGFGFYQYVLLEPA